MIHKISIIDAAKPVVNACVEVPIEGQPLGRPENLGGKFLDIRLRELLRLHSSKNDIRIYFYGSRYRFSSLTVDGDFELVRDWTADTLRSLEDQLRNNRNPN
jgi:hypothetical protein